MRHPAKWRTVSPTLNFSERDSAPESYVADQGRHVGRAGRVEITDNGRDIWVGGKLTARVRGTIDL